MIDLKHLYSFRIAIILLEFLMVFTECFSSSLVKKTKIILVLFKM